MNYSTDKPIETENKDLLSRSSFSKQLGKGIYEYNDKSGLVIGLFGKWGTGKTSVINMAEEEINRLSQTDENKPLIMKFSPWNYSDKDNLISLFFHSLKVKIALQDNDQIKTKLGKALSDYADAFETLSYIPYVGSALATVLKTIAKTKGENLMEIPDLDETRKILEDELVKLDKKIIIVIDDIDRLTNSQIRDVFQLVKQVGDFPNVIYILVMDRKIVQKALESIHEVDGSQYLEKIIQIPLEVPVLSKSKLDDIFLKKLEDIIKNASYKVNIDQMYWNIVFSNCISPYINNLRDINRILNTFQFRYGILQNETSFEDMVAITTLEVLEPKLYKWIATNKEVVCQDSMNKVITSIENKYNRKKYSDEFNKIKVNENKALKSIATIFPQISKNINENLYFERSNFDMRKSMRIAIKERFDIYFLSDLSDIKVSRKLINLCIFKFEKKQLRNVIKEIKKDGDMIYFLEEISSLVKDIPYNRLFLISSVLLSLQGELAGETSNTILAISAEEKSNIVIERMLDRFKSDNERYIVLNLAMYNINEINIGIFSELLINLGQVYGVFKNKSSTEEYKKINVEYLQKIYIKFVEKVEYITSNVFTSEITSFRSVFYLWKFVDGEGLSKYIEKIFETEVGKLKFISSLAGKWKGNDIGWEYYSNEYVKYISDKEIYNIIMKFDKNMLHEFTELEQIKLASFVCNYDKGEFDRASEDEARELVKQWELEARIINSNIK